MTTHRQERCLLGPSDFNHYYYLSKATAIDKAARGPLGANITRSVNQLHMDLESGVIYLHNKLRRQLNTHILYLQTSENKHAHDIQDLAQSCRHLRRLAII